VGDVAAWTSFIYASCNDYSVGAGPLFPVSCCSRAISDVCELADSVHSNLKVSTPR
jgi:hypothetical protein